MTGLRSGRFKSWADALENAMSCTHREPGRYVEQVYDWWTEETELVWVEGASTQVDISLGAFRCTKCGEVGYYTGNWKRYYEEGVPCAGSDTVPRKLPNTGNERAEGSAR